MKVTVLLILPLVLFSCKKDKLKNEYTLFRGYWTLEVAVKNYYNNSGSLIQSDTLSVIDNLYTMVFDYNGKIRFYIDGKLLDKKRLVFESFTESPICESMAFLSTEAPFYNGYINLNNDAHDQMKFCLNEANMMLHYDGYPFPDGNLNGNDIVYTTFFKKL